MNTRNTTFAALIFVAIYNIIFFNAGFGIAAGLFFLLLNIYFFLAKTNNENLNFALLCFAVGILFAFLFSFRANEIVQLVDLASALFFSLAALYFYRFSGMIRFQIPGFILIPLRVTEQSIGGLFRIFKQKEKDSSTGISKKDTNSALIKGLLITIPIFGTLLLLLRAADPIFAKLTQNILESVGERSIISAILFTVLMGLGLARFMEKSSGEKGHTVSEGKSHELSVITGSIIGLFAVFIIVQLRYLFVGVGERELHQLGITSLTYSEYVRKGFFELLIAASLALGVIIYVFRYLHNLKGPEKLLLQIFSGVLTFETGLLLLSAAKRLALYADTHGLTRARIFGFIFLIWLAVLLTIFLIRVFREMKEKEFFAGTVLTTLIMLVFINVVNVDGLIAQKYKPTVNGEIDYFYLTSLSTDAKDSWKESIEYAGLILTQLESLNELSAEDNRKLYWARATMNGLNTKIIYLKKEKKWQSFNFSEYNALRLIVSDPVYFDQIPVILARMAKLEDKISNQVRQNTNLDRSTQPPLLR